MSFSSDVKQEITQNFVMEKSAALSTLCALFLVRASLHIAGGESFLSFQTENAAIAKFVYQILKTYYPQEELGLSVMKKMNLKKNNIYRLQVHGNINEILESLTILRPQGLSPVPSYTMVRSEKNARAFLQGIFLACGSINSPKTANYHMELSLPQKQQAELCSKLLSRFYIPSKIVKRKQYYVLYTKAGDKIADFLRLCNVSRCLFEFEDARITRDYYNQLTRLDNCEVANEMKTIKAAAEQLAWIETIEKKGGVKISDKLQRVIDARKAHPEASTMELCKVIEEQYGETISKSGMKHRLGKLKETAARLEEADAR